MEPIKTSIARALSLLACATLASGCGSERHYRAAEKRAYGIVQSKQREALQREESFTIEVPSDTLRRRLLLGQKLPFSGPASLGSSDLPPVPHSPARPARSATNQTTRLPESSVRPLRIALNDALQIAAANSRDFQGEKEQVFRAALELDLERDQFRTSFAGLITTLFAQDRSSLAEPAGAVRDSINASAALSATRALKNGSAVSLQLGWNLLQLLEPARFTSRSLFGDASIEIPLLRGAGRHIAAEPLTQAERDALYAIYNFETFKRQFAVRVAGEYLAVLQRTDQVKNAEENYRGLIASTRRARRLLDAGDLPPIQVDQATQEELSARNRWISARESRIASLDEFKSLLGLPADALVELDDAEFDRLAAAARRIGATPGSARAAEPVPSADAPIVLAEPSKEGAGPFELDPERAIRIALDERLDLRAAHGNVVDAQRRVVIAADRLRPELTLFGRARVEGARAREIRPDHGQYEAFLTLNPPFERTAEGAAYRASYIALEQAVRNVQALEDEIKRGVRERLRTLRETRESVQIQALAVELARRRVRGADLNLQAGRVQIRDLLEAQEDLLSAQNALTAAAVDYRLAELELQRDLGVLEVHADGLWKEFDPAAARDATPP